MLKHRQDAINGGKEYLSLTARLGVKNTKKRLSSVQQKGVSDGSCSYRDEYEGRSGKTTVAMHLGGMLGRYTFGAAKTRKILLIDYDPQFNLSQAFLSAETYFELEGKRKTTISVLLDDDSDLNPYQLQVPGNHIPPKVSDIVSHLDALKDGGRLDIVPSTLDLMYVALGQSNAQTKPIEERFEKFITECRSIYDLTFIDCHPAGSLFTKTSLRNSDHVVIPVVPQRYAVRGIGLMLNFIRAKKQGTSGPEPHILFNSTQRVGMAPEEKEIRANAAYAKYCMTNTLKWYKAFTEPEGGTGFVWYSTKPWSTEAFRNLSAVTQELVTRIGV
jgi:chromosome partitioning protein